MEGTEIVKIDRFKYLGFLFHNKLNFSYQVNHCINQVTHKLFLLRKIRTYMCYRTSLLIYKSMVLPYLEYGSCFLLLCNRSERRKFQRLQNRGAKLALNKGNLYSAKKPG